MLLINVLCVSLKCPECPSLFQGGYDSGYLYHCKFSEEQSEDPLERKDEPFFFLPVHDTDHNPILTITFK